jgi:hypothetical protein
MKHVMASLHLIAVSRSGRRSRASVLIGFPYEVRDGKGADCAACPLSIRGLGRHAQMNPRRIMGADTFQALSITLSFVRLRLLDFVGSGGRLLYPDEAQFEVDPYFPRYEPEPNRALHRMAAPRRRPAARESRRGRHR